jgi:hypothetical protein
MAGNLPVPLGAEVKLVWAWQGVPYALNILHFAHDIGAIHNQAKADAIATFMASTLGTSGLASLLATGVSLLRTESRHMDSNSDPWFIGAAAAVPGTSAGNPLPAATAFVVTLKTGLRGRSFNGRVYLWGYTEDANDAAGGITSAARDISVGFLNGIFGGMAAQQQWDMAVLSRWTTPPTAPPNTPPTERTPPLLTPVSQAVALDQRWDVQRRRAIAGI